MEEDDRIVLLPAADGDSGAEIELRTVESSVDPEQNGEVSSALLYHFIRPSALFSCGFLSYSCTLMPTHSFIWHSLTSVLNPTTFPRKRTMQRQQ